MSEACAAHDQCYYEHNCSAGSWSEAVGACAECNWTAAASILLCAVGLGPRGPCWPDNRCAIALCGRSLSFCAPAAVGCEAYYKSKGAGLPQPEFDSKGRKLTSACDPGRVWDWFLCKCVPKPKRVPKTRPPVDCEDQYCFGEPVLSVVFAVPDCEGELCQAWG
jgi:hypothetical protein